MSERRSCPTRSNLLYLAGGALAGVLLNQLIPLLSRSAPGCSSCPCSDGHGSTTFYRQRRRKKKRCAVHGHHPDTCGFRPSSSSPLPSTPPPPPPSTTCSAAASSNSVTTTDGSIGEEEKDDGLSPATAGGGGGEAADLTSSSSSSRPQHRYWCSKTFFDLPCSHRQAAHGGHCRFIHGYSRSIKVFFGCRELDSNGFVVDFSSLKGLQAWLAEMFDHTMLINEDDPERELFEEMHRRGVVDLRVLPNVGMEESSRLVFEYADKMIREATDGRCWVFRVETHENAKNGGAYELL